jgi:hypothetical protein
MFKVKEAFIQDKKPLRMELLDKELDVSWDKIDYL